MFSSNTSSAASDAAQAEAIDYDGTNDWLSRTAGLTGVSNGKTFTLSFWVWNNNPALVRQQVICNTGAFPQQFTFSIVGTSLQFRAFDTSANNVLQGSADDIPLQTWTHVLVSFNTANPAQAWIYINDVAASVSFNAYQNFAINFNNGGWYVGSNSTSTDIYQGRFSNVYFDQTYRDMSITANRRLFVTADLKPAAGQAALSPIMYLPMSDPTAPGLNQGTGGNFTLTGVVARSGRGPNQYNAPYSDFDGAADYLSRTSVTGMADASTFTFACSFIVDVTTNSYIAQCGANEFAVRVQSGQLRLLCYATGSVLLVSATVDITGGFVVGRNYVVTISVDTTNSGKRHVYVNGAAATVTWSTYTSGSIYFAQTWRIGREATTPYFNGKLGALWFNTSYIDLSVAANLAKFVTGTGIDAKPVDPGASGELPTGSSPLIYLPLSDNNAGLNYGTGGDFTVNSGPYEGARGPNEFWGNRAVFDWASTSYIFRSTAVPTLTDGKTVSGSFWFSTTDAGAFQYIYDSRQSGGAATGIRLSIYLSGNYLTFQARSSASTTILLASSTNTLGNSAFSVQFSIDMANQSNSRLYINNVLETYSVGTWTNADIAFSQASWITIGANSNSGPTWSDTLRGRLAEFYLTNSFIDFSQEANRLKFRDAFGNPVNLPQQIEALAIPNPAIYMRFPPTSFGANSGTGGDFTNINVITDGGQL